MFGIGISILKVSNGYVVTFPENLDYIPEARDQMENFRLQARAMKEEFMGDDILNKISQEQEQEQKFPDEVIPVNNSVFIFKKFDEVIEFLKTRLVGS